jgi:hypothetical protein
MSKLRSLAFAAAVLAVPAAHAQDKLQGLEMDVMQPGQTPAQATSTIALPPQASTAAHGNNGAAQAADAHDNASANGQDNAEQAREKKDHSHPTHPEHPAPPHDVRPR